MLCPVCHTDLRTAKLRSDLTLELEVCPSCRGAWFDIGELTRLDGSVWADMERHPYHDVEGDHPDAMCPKCKEAMYDGRPMDFKLEPLSPPDAPDLIVDRCPSCFGFWLDRGELKRIVELANRYDDLKRTGREVDAELADQDRGAMAFVWAWPKLTDETKDAMLAFVSTYSLRRIRKNSLGLDDYDRQPRELRKVIDVWYAIPKADRKGLLDLLPVVHRPTSSRPGKSRRHEKETLNKRPSGWSWLKWMTHQFTQQLADDADDIF